MVWLPGVTMTVTGVGFDIFSLSTNTVAGGRPGPEPILSSEVLAFFGWAGFGVLGFGVLGFTAGSVGTGVGTGTGVAASVLLFTRVSLRVSVEPPVKASGISLGS